MEQEVEVKAEAEGAVAQAEAVVAAEATKPPEAPAVETEEVKALRVEVAKLTKQVEDDRGREIGHLKQAERDALIQRIADKQEALAEGVESQDWVAYRAKVQAINEAASQSQLTAETEAVRQEALTELMEINTAIGGGLETNPLFANVLLFYRNGRYEKSVAEARRVEAKMARDETAVQAKTHSKAIKDAEEAAAKAARVEAGVFDLGAGAEAGGGGKKRYTRGDLRGFTVAGRPAKEVAKEADAILDSYFKGR